NGIPTIVVPRSSDCVAIIDDTRPLTYGVQLGTVEEKENSLLTGLKDLTGLLGTTLAATAPLLHGFKFTPQANVSLSMKELSTQTDQPTPFEKLAAATFSLAVSLLRVGDLQANVV